MLYSRLNARRRSGFFSSFTTAAADPCTLPFTPVYTIQGNGLSTIPGNVTTQGIVVGDFQGTAAAFANSLQGLGWMLLIAVLAGCAIVVLQNALTVLDNYVNTKLDQSMVLDFRSDLFQHAQKLSMAFHDHRRSGQLIFAINSQGDAVARLVSSVPPLAQTD